MKKALDPHIKRVSQTAVKKIRTDIKKQQGKKMPTKKETEGKTRGSFDDLHDLVNIKKQKAIANELDSMIYDQQQEKVRREGKNVTTSNFNPRMGNPVEVVIANDPDKLKGMTLEDAKKLSMFTNKSGVNSNISDIKEVIIALNEIKKVDGGNSNLSDKIIGHLLDKAFDNNNGNNQKENSNNEFMKYMMEQNLQNQNLLIKVIEAKSSTQNNPQNDYMKEIITLVKNQGDFENAYLKGKLQEAEMRIQPTDSLGEASRVMDYMTKFKGFLGVQPQTPEGYDHEYKMRTLELDQIRQTNEESIRDKRMTQIGDMINNTIGAFGEALGEPIVEATKAKIEEFTESVKHPKKKPTKKTSPTILQKEIDLGDIEALEEELIESENSNNKRKRFRVYEHAK